MATRNKKTAKAADNKAADNKTADNKKTDNKTADNKKTAKTAAKTAAKTTTGKTTTGAGGALSSPALDEKELLGLLIEKRSLPKKDVESSALATHKITYYRIKDNQGLYLNYSLTSKTISSNSRKCCCFVYKYDAMQFKKFLEALYSEALYIEETTERIERSVDRISRETSRGGKIIGGGNAQYFAHSNCYYSYEEFRQEILTYAKSNDFTTEFTDKKPTSTPACSIRYEFKKLLYTDKKQDIIDNLISE